MAEIPMASRAKRPAFFNDAATDQIVSMMLELMSELWVVKERVFTLEKVLSTNGLNVAEEIEACELGDDEKAGLEKVRQQFVNSILRALEADFVSHDSLSASTDALTEQMKSGI
jgi:hypothetical protein